MEIPTLNAGRMVANPHGIGKQMRMFFKRQKQPETAAETEKTVFQAAKLAGSANRVEKPADSSIFPFFRLPLKTTAVGRCIYARQK